MIVLSHRGIDKGVLPESAESSLPSFRVFLRDGFGFEFDLQITEDSELVVWHDADLSRLTSGKDKTPIRKLKFAAIEALVGKGRICKMSQIFELLRSSRSPLLALHWKADNQNLFIAEKLADLLGQYVDLHPRLLVFDVRKEWGEWLNEQFPRLNLALSVAHPFDVERFGASVGDTLYSLEDALAWRAVGKWLWLDEWDLIGQSGGRKQLYSFETFKKIRAAGLKAAVISPELHKAHPDGQSLSVLRERWKAIADFSPEAICTDYASQWLR